MASFGLAWRVGPFDLAATGVLSPVEDKSWDKQR